MRYLFALSLTLGALLVACVGEKPISRIEATDEEAIYNVLFNDYPRLTSLDLLSTEIPDTLSFLANPDSSGPLLWHEVEEIHDTLAISISPEPVPSPVGDVYQSGVLYSIRYTGNFNIWRFNAAADSIERFSKSFTVNGSRAATCQQWGFPNQQRRGWLLTSIGDAHFYTPGNEYHMLDGLGYSSATHPTKTAFAYGSHDPGQLLSFTVGEEIQISFALIDTTDLVLLYIPLNDFGYQLALPQIDSLGDHFVVFNAPARKIYGQLRFLVINAGDGGAVYKSSGYSYNYRIR